MDIKRWFQGVVGIGLVTASTALLKPSIPGPQFAPGQKQLATEVLPIAVQGNTEATVQAIRNDLAEVNLFQDTSYNAASGVWSPTGGPHPDADFDAGKAAVAPDLIRIAQEGNTQATVAALKSVLANANKEDLASKAKTAGGILLGAGGFVSLVFAALGNGGKNSQGR